VQPREPKEIRGFGLSLSSTMGAKRDARRGSFVESVLNATEAFYGEVLQKLRPWKAAPPKLKKSVEPGESPEEAVAEFAGVEPNRSRRLDRSPTPILLGRRRRTDQTPRGVAAA
jgi:hypothetical protein